MTLDFQPWEPLLLGRADKHCEAVVIIPARNEEYRLALTLDALGAQVDLNGRPLDAQSFEVLLLLNNCTDASATVAETWSATHPNIRLHIVERSLPADIAFVGHARRMLMDTAWHRLAGRTDVRAILSTDADTLAHPEWVARNLAALAAGADAVGGAIELIARELRSLPRGVQRAYLRDRRYQRLVAMLEDRLDPQRGDPAPRHLQHFGASLACTPEAYARAGGLPAITPLEDVAFVGRLRRTGAILRHDPTVKVYTSSRIHGRVEVGLSGQLKLWQQMTENGKQHTVQTAHWLAHRFNTLRRLRAEAASHRAAEADYLADVDCDRVIRDSFNREQEGDIVDANRELTRMLREPVPVNSVPAGQAESPDEPHDEAASIRRGPAMLREPHRR